MRKTKQFKILSKRKMPRNLVVLKGHYRSHPYRMKSTRMSLHNSSLQSIERVGLKNLRRKQLCKLIQNTSMPPSTGNHPNSSSFPIKLYFKIAMSMAMDTGLAILLPLLRPTPLKLANSTLCLD